MHESYLAFSLASLSYVDQPWGRDKCPFRKGDANMKITTVKPTLIELYVPGTLLSCLYGLLVHFVLTITLESGHYSYSHFTDGETEAPEMPWLKATACLQVQAAWV